MKSRESLKTAAFLAAAAALAIVAAVRQPERATPKILSDQGEPFYPKFRDPEAVRIIEVVDYDETTATARPFQVEFQKGRWVLPSNYNYPVEAGEQLAKTTAALMDLRRDLVRSDAVPEYPKYGVVDPLDTKTASLTGRGKRVTLRDAHREVLADFILGKPVEGKSGWRYVRLPGQKRVYAVKTDADPSARFADWVNAAILRIPAGTIRKVLIQSYGEGGAVDAVPLTHENGRWSMEGAAKLNLAAVHAMAAALENLRIADVRPKPRSLAADLKSGRVELSLETAMSLRQRGFFISQTGRLLASEGEMSIELTNGLTYVLRFGDPAGAGDNHFLFVTASSSANPAAAQAANNRFAEWYYIISGADFQKLRLKRKDIVGRE